MDLSEPQRQFAKSPYPFPCFCGGFGSGKTHAAILRTLSLKSQCMGQDVAYYLPTFDLVRTVAFPRFAEMMNAFGVSSVLNRSDKTMYVPGWQGSIIFRTMDSPETIVGYEVAHSIVDELDTLPEEKARDAWNKIIARNRQKCGMMNTVSVATTPEGFRFVWRRWVKDKPPGYRLYKARTSDNAANLPPGYIDSLKASYPTNLLAAYLDGEFVNLTAGSVYPEFNRELNASRETIRRAPTPEPLHIGMDFNVGKMAAVVFVLREGQPHAVEELTELLDTPAMIAAIKKRYPGHQILVYPDSTGKNREANNASVSDISLLRAANFMVCMNPSNPAVKDRVLAMNAMIHASGVRRLRVNIDGCPAFVEGLEKQSYAKNGEPDKKSGLDHSIDAGGYFIAYKFPIRSRGMVKLALAGV
jgi:hypothetical protein